MARTCQESDDKHHWILGYPWVPHFQSPNLWWTSAQILKEIVSSLQRETWRCWLLLGVLRERKVGLD